MKDSPNKVQIQRNGAFPFAFIYFSTSHTFASRHFKNGKELYLKYTFKFCLTLVSANFLVAYEMSQMNVLMFLPNFSHILVVQ